MKIRLKYIDNEAFSPDEIEANLKALFGQAAEVEVYPDSTDPHSLIYFAIQRLITIEQVDAYFHGGALYDSRIKELRAEVMQEVEKTFDQVVQDNKDKLEE